MHIQRLAPSHAPVFLVNSRYPLVCATPKSFRSKSFHHRGPPLHRSNGSYLPSSLTRIRSIALVFSTTPPVSVWGTGGMRPHAEAFLDGRDHRIHAYARPIAPHPNAPRICLGDGPNAWPGKTTSRAGCPSVSLLRSPTGATVPAPPRPPSRRTDRMAGRVSTRPFGLIGRKPVREYQPVHPFDYACRPRLRTRLTQGR